MKILFYPSFYISLCMLVSCGRELCFPITIYLHKAIENNDISLYDILDNQFSSGTTVTEHYIAAYDSEAEVLNLYDRSGIFLNQVASRGLEVGEFDAIYDLKIDETTQKIYVLDWKKLHIYSLQGKYLQSLNLSIEEPDGFAIIKNGAVLVHNSIYGGLSKTSYIIYDASGKIVYVHPNVFQYFSSSAFDPTFTTDFCSYLFDHDVYVKDKNDTLFCVRTNDLVPMYVFNDSRALITNKRSRAEEYNHAYQMVRMAESSDYLVFETKELENECAKLWSYDKKNRQLYFSMITLKKTVPFPMLKRNPIPISTSNISIKNFSESINGISFKMIAIPEGSYLRKNDNQDSIESTIHLKSYYIAETEVTQALWKAITGKYHASYKENAQEPVSNVTWTQVVDCIKKLNTLGGKSFRLPTEAEWEYAACGAQTQLTKWAGTDQENELGKYAYFMNESGKFASVKSKLPNRLGLYDMTGNVSEWCMDWYPEMGRAKILKGWDFLVNASEHPQIADKKYLPPDLANYTNGFRLAMSAQ